MEHSVSLDDLTGLFGAPPAGMATPSSVMQGRLLSFSTVDGSNTVLVNGGVLTNVPMLLTGTEVNYSPSDPVLLIILGNTYMLLGKVAGVASAQFASASVATQAALGTASGFAFPATPGGADYVSTTLTVPSWSNHVAIQAFGSITVKNNFGADVDINIRLRLAGVPSNFTDNYGKNGSYNTMTLGFSITQAVTPGSTLTCTTVGSCTGGFTADAGNQASISALALFTKQ
jgi:hypothetical protein